MTATSSDTVTGISSGHCEGAIRGWVAEISIRARQSLVPPKSSAAAGTGLRREHRFAATVSHGRV